MAKKINKRQWKKEAKRKKAESSESFAICTFHDFCRFIQKIPEKYNTDPDFPETPADYTMALDMFIEDEAPFLKMQDDTAEGQRNRAAVKYIEEEISFIDSGDCEVIIGGADGEFKTNMSFLELVKLRGNPFSQFFIA